MENSLSKRREAAPDILKLLACVGVCLIHVSSQAVTELPIGSFGWLSGVIWDGLARFAVPVFLMCTGALMLPPEKTLSVRVIWQKYFLRVLVILLFWAWAYYVFGVVGIYIMEGWHEERWFLNSILQTLRLNHYLHLYYLQMLLLVYACLPVLRVFTRSADEKELRYACGLWLVLGIAGPLLKNYPPLSWLGGLSGQMYINMCWSSVGYALLGYTMFSSPVRQEKRWVYILLIVLGAAVSCGGTAAVSMLRGENFLDLMEGMSPGPAMLSVGLVGLVRILAEGKASSPAMARLVKASFTVYLIHLFFVMIFRYLGFGAHLFAPIAQIPLETAAVLLLSLVGRWLLSKIPFVKDHLI